MDLISYVILLIFVSRGWRTVAFENGGQLLLDLHNARAVIGELFQYEIGTDAFRKIYVISQVRDAKNNRLPDWLFYNASSSELMGVPLVNDLGQVFVAVGAHCINESYLCKDQSEVFLIDVVDIETAPETSNRSPFLVKPLNQIIAKVGEYFEYEISVHMFHDVEDGDTSHLALSLRFPFNDPVPDSFWLKLNASTHIIYGIPLVGDAEELTTIILTATDSGGATGKDAIQLLVDDSFLSSLTHRFTISLNISYDIFYQKHNSVLQLAHMIARYFGDASLDSLRILDVEEGSLNLTWTNSSFSGSICKKKEIMRLLESMVFKNESVVPEFADSMLGYQILNISYELLGPCLSMPTVLPPKRATEKIVYETDFNMWVEIVIPALAAVLVLVIVVLILFIVCRHRKPSEPNILKSEKKTFMDDRKPIIFPEELEMDGPTLKSQKPLVLPGDNPEHVITDDPDAILNKKSKRYEPTDDVFIVNGRQNPPLPPPYILDTSTDPPPYRLPPSYLGKHGLAALHV